MKDKKSQNNTWQKFLMSVKNVFYPRHIKCIFCGKELNESARYDSCENCQKTLPIITKFCAHCGDSLKEEEEGVCLSCKTKNYNFNFARSVFEYKGRVVGLIRKMKFDSKIYPIESMAKYMAEVYATMGVNVDFITYVPMTNKHKRKRGFNQSELLAKELSKLIGVVCLDLLVKVKETKAQSSLVFKDRMKNLVDAFAVSPQFLYKLKDKSVLIVDDILTTGATTNEISRVLKEHGVRSCYVLTFARTHLKELC